ncbi:alpha/beta hydrolase [uncultured Spongiibacter sp.]|uniref:alpha/beta fold hydrolase n=1 Tax=uncultured Spongiibacter sp. TaxID=870896 RepID=UPI002591FA84|nr:alpha/beta hydrolase [uncultured Spongiibacter sp.]
MLEYRQGNFGRGEAVWLQGGQALQNQAPRNQVRRHVATQPAIHFAPANGFPVASYRFFLKHFADEYPLLGLENRGAWGEHPPAPDFNWRGHADDLIAFLDQHSHGPVIGIGHSIGATVTPLAAARRPDLFRALILCDPATLPGRYLYRAHRLVAPHFTRHLSLVKRTRKRPTHWPSRQAFIDYHRNKPVFRPFSDEAFADYAEAALIEQDDGQLAMRYHPDWEAQNFSQTHSPWQALKRIQCPTLLLRAEHSFLHPEAVFRYHSQRLPDVVDCMTVAGRGHMLLQEDGDGVAEHCKHWLDSLTPVPI